MYHTHLSPHSVIIIKEIPIVKIHPIMHTDICIFPHFDSAQNQLNLQDKYWYSRIPPTPFTYFLRKGVYVARRGACARRRLELNSARPVDVATSAAARSDRVTTVGLSKSCGVSEWTVVRYARWLRRRIRKAGRI